MREFGCFSEVAASARRSVTSFARTARAKTIETLLCFVTRRGFLCDVWKLQGKIDHFDPFSGFIALAPTHIGPSFPWTFIVLVCLAIINNISKNTSHNVSTESEMRKGRSTTSSSIPNTASVSSLSSRYALVVWTVVATTMCWRKANAFHLPAARWTRFVSHPTTTALVSPTSMTSLFMVETPDDETSSETSNTTDLVNGDSISMVPRPPDESPQLALLAQEYDALKQQREQTSNVIQELTDRARTLQEQLSMKQQELDASREEWTFEKKSFLDKIAELTGLVEQNDYVNQEEKYRQEKLESEVKLLQNQIVQVNMALKREQKASEELRERLEDVNDAMEFEQMNFEKERAALQEKLKEEKKRLKEIKEQWDLDKERFESARGVVQTQLDEERERLKKAQLDWAENQFEYEEQQASLKAMLQEQRARLAETESLLESERAQFGEEREALKSVIAADRLKLEEIEQALKEERISFQASQAELESRILDEQDKVDALYVKLQEEQERFYQEKDNLEVSLDIERKRVQRVEADLENEKKGFEAEKKKLEEEIDEQVRINRLKKKQMKRRYEAIRTQLTGLWEGAKQDARNERKQLTAKYEGKLATMSQKVAELETNLFSARKSSEELATVMSDLEQQRDKAREETQTVEARYITMLSQRNREIAQLKTGMNELKETVRQREEQLEKYESSFRALLQLSVRVTGTKVKKTRSRLSGIFRRKRDD